jgi:Family of unknown function (DUF6275)
MTEGPPPAVFTVPTPASIRPRVPGDEDASLDPDRFLQRAKRLVAENYNTHHDAEMTPPLGIDDVYIIWFTKVLTSWKAVVCSTVVRGLMWVVTFNGPRNEAYIEIYRKINNVVVSKGEPS